MLSGVIRPGWDGGMNAHVVDGHCFYFTFNGQRWPGYLLEILPGRRFPHGHDWEGVQSMEQGDRIGMLLDFDQGSMTVWKNDVKLGVTQAAAAAAAEGLSGPLCWGVLMRSAAHIESSPTEEELAAAKVWRPGVISDSDEPDD